MKFLYACDIHGDKNKYNKLLEIAKKQNLHYMVWGGDLLPKKYGPRKIIQAEFLDSGFFNEYFTKLQKNNITCVLIPGNDDLERFDKRLNEICESYSNIINVDKTKATVEDITFIGLSNVLDNPFRSKNRVLMEDGLKMEKQLSNEIWIKQDTEVITEDEWRIYREKYVEKMKDVLNKLPKLKNNEKTIYILHDPPYGIGLDDCSVGVKAGSKDIVKFLTKSGAYMSLHGHIHESPKMSGIWKANLGQTICIQPGQTELGEEKMVYAVVDTDNNTAERFIEKAVAVHS